MKKRLLPVFTIGLLLGVSAEAAQSPPLSQVVRTIVGECTSVNETKVPLITWGGDLATVYANGNNRDTVKGSIFAGEGLKIKLFREDVFAKQLESYLKCDSPYVRGTLGMINMAAEVANRDPRTAMKVVYQMTWSVGGDALVVREGVKKPADLKGKTVAIQAYGPHVDYMTTILTDAGLSMSDVTVVWTKDLVGFEGDTPAKVFRTNQNIAAVFAIIPDASALTSGGKVGTGGEDSVRGATILLSTKMAANVISDVYAVRADYLNTHRKDVEKFVHGLMIANEHLAALVKAKDTRPAEFQQMISAGADILLDSPQATADAIGMYGDAKFVGWTGNVKFFGDPNYPRNFARLTEEAQTAFVALGLLNGIVALEHARFDYNAFKAGLTDTSGVEAPRFDTVAVDRVVKKRQQQDTLNEGALFSFAVFFKPNQKTFDPDGYKSEFDRVIDLASTYGGAIITVEGHTDPKGYLDAKKSQNTPEVALRRIKQAALNLSLSRANEVRDSVIAYAQSKGITLDPTQLAVVGHGIMKPKNGTCGGDPCAPQTEQQWLDNMRVEFQIINVEAESTVFKQ